MTKLDRAANVAVLVVSAVALLVLGKTYLFASDPRLGVQPGDRVAALAELVPNGADQALLVALSPDCHYCTESMPFYSRLLRETKERPTPLIALVSSAGERVREVAIAASAGVAFDDVVVADFPRARLVATPTVVHVDRRGKVLDVWRGQLTPDAEREVHRALAE